MQFLKSILFPKPEAQKNTKEKEKILILEARVALLEAENKKSVAAIQELSTCVQSISILMSELATDVSVLANSVNSIIKQSQSSFEDDIFKRYLNDDDDDGYLN